jgi:hypothetical protein
MKFEHAKDVFVCNYIMVVKIFSAYLHKMYNDLMTSF